MSMLQFLPRRAIIMLKSGTPPMDIEPAQTPAPALTPTPDSLKLLAADLQGCSRCKLCEKRTTLVFGEGNPNADLVFVGEGPGEQEDLSGRPFVGKAGELLEKMINAIGLQRSDVYILNVVKCRPPGNRNPEPDEIEACRPFLDRQLELLNPKVVVALGKFAAQTLLATDARISELRGRFHPYRGAKLMPTFHPAYLLRSPESKREAWDDLQKVAQDLGLAIPARR